MIKEFKYAFRFLGIFLGLYLLLNLLYGWWIESYSQADPVTWLTTRHASDILQVMGEPAEAKYKENSRSVSLLRTGDVVVNVYEGCNGLNVAIVFVSFIAAFGGPIRKALWFIPLGGLIIYLFNIGRIAGLYLVAQYLPDYFYYVHKYAFTASIYLVVVILWWWWVDGLQKKDLRKILISAS